MSRQQAHQLLDRLGPTQFAAVANLLEILSAEPLATSLAQAPVDDKELTPETGDAIDRARASLANGEGIAHDDVLREFGLAK